MASPEPPEKPDVEMLYERRCSDSKHDFICPDKPSVLAAIGIFFIIVLAPLLADALINA